MSTPMYILGLLLIVANAGNVALAWNERDARSTLLGSVVLVALLLCMTVKR